jgi:hypothetical protein
VESPPPSDTGRPAIPIRHNQPNTPPSTHYIRPEQVARKIEAHPCSQTNPVAYPQCVAFDLATHTVDDARRLLTGLHDQGLLLIARFTIELQGQPPNLTIQRADLFA